MKKGAATSKIEEITPPTAAPTEAPMPPILPIKREWRAAVLEAAGAPNSEPELKEAVT